MQDAEQSRPSSARLASHPSLVRLAKSDSLDRGGSSSDSYFAGLHEPGAAPDYYTPEERSAIDHCIE